MQATLILGGRPTATYTLRRIGQSITITTTQGDRTYDEGTLANIHHGTHFTDVQITPPASAAPWDGQ
ncbi:hypothetical protein GCM10008955_41070 [Deinococcus malanensis]|uniref:Uncharacterized protein n=1 Tax=Deinococcus malanensis TaxID=1706855 RepID=A0ABQ2F1Z3_9DEIO|nr:hypothetical protein [Deinococcus malanensis]GGK43084.1 hypothetical protein GCM10008955_41070 [Deinococcus malanensis]